METPKDMDEVIEICKFPISDELKISSRADIEPVKRYFTWTIDGQIDSLLRATFIGRTLIKEEVLAVPNGTQWKKTHTFSKAWILGSDNYFMDEVDLAEIQTHLPAGVSA
jgi:hypothetical protein